MIKAETTEIIYEAILNVLNVSEEMLKSASRKANYVDARKIFSYLCREKKITYMEIGAMINREHSTVSFQVEMFPKTIKFDSVLRKKFFDVKLYIDNKIKKNEQ